MSYLFQVSICTILFYLLYFLFYRKQTNHVFNRFFLLAALLVSLWIPLLHIPLFPELADRVLSPLPITAVTTAPATTSFTWVQLFWLIYAMGVAAKLVRLGIQLFRLSQLIRESRKEKSAGLIKVYTRREIPVSSFLSFLFIPEEKKGSISEFELLHEAIHIRQKHSLDLLFFQLFSAAFWLNPLLIFYKQSITETHEYLADHATSRAFGRESYENFLINQIVANNQWRLTHNFHSLFKKRLDMMRSKSQMKAWHYLAILPIVGISLSLFSFKSYPVYPGNQENLISLPDTFPPVPTELLGKQIDTLIIFDPNTFEETVKYVERDPLRVVEPGENTAVPSSGIDTMIIFDPETFEETVIIINNKTMERDTLK
jgi:hypothetical protein